MTEMFLNVIDGAVVRRRGAGRSVGSPAGLHMNTPLTSAIPSCLTGIAPHLSHRALFPTSGAVDELTALSSGACDGGGSIACPSGVARSLLGQLYA